MQMYYFNINFTISDSEFLELLLMQLDVKQLDMVVSKEKPSKYFCSLEKYYCTENTIRKLIKQNGQSSSDQKEILEETRNFYANLFKNRDSDLKKTLSYLTPCLDYQN